MSENKIALAIPKLAETCRQLGQDNIPAAVWIEDVGGGRFSSHWSSTRDAMQKALGVERLSDHQLAALSFSRCFGPVPTTILNEEDAGALMCLLWPTGNHRDSWYHWYTLASALQGLLQAHQRQR